MARLIDADALEDSLGISDMDIYAKESIREAPTIDAVPVVRCKDCKHFGHNLENDTFCRVVSGMTDPEENDFCSYGERKDNGK